MRSKYVPLTLLVLLAAAVPRLWVARNHWQNSQNLWRDNVYVRAASTYAAEGPFTGGVLFQPVERTGVEPSLYTRHPPSYPLAIGLSFALFGETWWAARIPDLAASMFCVFLLWRISRRSERDIPDVSFHVPLLLAFTPGLVWGTFSGDCVSTWALAGQILVIWSYLAYRDAWSPVAGPLFVVAGVAGLFTDWLALASTFVCVVHLWIDRDAPPAGKRVALMAAGVSLAAFVLLLMFYVSPAGALSGPVIFLSAVMRHVTPEAWSTGFWRPITGILPLLRNMLMLPVLLIGVWEILFQAEDARPNGIRTATRLLLFMALIQTGLFSAGSLIAHPYLLMPLVTVISFAAAVRLARYPQALLSFSALAILLAASVWGIRGRIEADRRFYGPVISLYDQARQMVLDRTRAVPSTEQFVAGTNIWVPEDYFPRNMMFIRTDDPAITRMLPLDAYLAAGSVRDLTPLPYRQLEASRVLASLNEVPLQTGETFRWIPLSRATAGPQTVEPSVQVSAAEGLSFSWTPPLPLTDVEIVVLDRVYRAGDILREGQGLISLALEEGRMTIRYRSPDRTGPALLNWLRNYPLLTGRYSDAFARVHLKNLKTSFTCPLPGEKPIQCRKVPS